MGKIIIPPPPPVGGRGGSGITIPPPPVGGRAGGGITIPPPIGRNTSSASTPPRRENVRLPDNLTSNTARQCSDETTVRTQLANHSHVQLLAASGGNPATRYRIGYKIRGIESISQNTPRYRDWHEITSRRGFGRIGGYIVPKPTQNLMYLLTIRFLCRGMCVL